MKELLKKTILHRVFLLLFLCTTNIALAETQKAIFPMRGTVSITQGYGTYGGYSHADSYRRAVDYGGYLPMYAPFDCVVKWADLRWSNGNSIVIQSKNPVQLANGEISYVSLHIAHCEDVTPYNIFVGREFKQGELFYMGGAAGNVTGPHVHMECSKAAYKWVNYGTSTNEIYLLDQLVGPDEIFFVDTSITSINNNGVPFNWKSTGRNLTLSITNGTYTKGKSGYYQPGSIIQLTATANPGYIFKEWTTSNGGTFSNKISEETTVSCDFTMPDCDTTVTAVFEEDPSATITEWVQTSSSSTETDASITGIFHTKRALISFSFLHPKVTSLYCYVGRSRDAVACATPQSHASTVYFHAADPSGAVNDRDKTYSYTVSSVNSLKDDSNATLGLKAGETYYYKWIAVVDGKQVASAVQQGNLPSPSGYWYNTAVATDSPFNSVFKYNSNLLFVEDGCFVSTDRNKVLSATKDNHPDVIFKNESNANGFSYWTEGDYKHTKVFYNLPFSTLTAFEPGVPYYYKFYAVTSNGSVIYTPDIGCYTAPAVTTYPLTIKANTGGTITTGTSGSYAPGTVIQLGALPTAGYKFGSWTSTAGELRNGTSTSASFVMPASAATVTANFGYDSYTVTTSTSGEGSISGLTGTTFTYGSKIQLTATPASGYVFKVWSSQSGSFSSTTAATTTFTVPASNTAIQATFIKKEDALSITTPVSTELTVGSTLQLTATGELAQSLSWSSSDTSVATVTSAGMVTAHNAGTATITVTNGTGVCDQITVVCISENIQIELLINGKLPGDNCQAVWAQVGDTLDIKLICPDNVSNVSYEYSSDYGILEYDGAGLKAVKPGIDSLTCEAYQTVNGTTRLIGSTTSVSVIVTDPSQTLALPSGLITLEEDAFAGTAATAFIIPDSVTTISSRFTTQENQFVYVIMDTTIARTIADDAFPANAGCIVDIGSGFNQSFFLLCEKNLWKYYTVGADSDDYWTTWTDWQESPVSSSNTVQVETKTQYRSAPITTTTTYSAWSDWGAWTTGNPPVTDAMLYQAQTRSTYPYYYFVCSSCGTHMPFWGSSNSCLTYLGGCGKYGTIPEGSFGISIGEIPVSKSACHQYSGKYYTVFNNKTYFYWDDGSSPEQQKPQLQYSYRTRTRIQVPVIGTYGAWTDDVLTASDTLSVETRVLYRYRINIK